MALSAEHLAYLTARGVNPALADRYSSDGAHLAIAYLDPTGQPYLDSKGQPYTVRRLFPTQQPKFKAPFASGSRPYFSPLMPEGYLDDTTIPLVLIEGPIKVDACYSHIPTGYCFVGLNGTWNTKDRRGGDGIWLEDNDTRVIPELKAIPMRGRVVIVLFDSDIDDNISVDEAAGDIANWTRQRGAKPHRCTLPSEEDGAKNGADDFLVRHGAEALLALLEAAEIEGWPLPAPLLTRDGDLKRSYTPAERKRLSKALAEVSDAEAVDTTCRVLATKLRIPFSQLLADIDDARSGTTGDGFLASEEDLDGDDDIDGNWVIPFLLPKGETIVISGDPGVSKSLLCYSIALAVATGTEFLGFPVAKGVPLILQLEEGGTASRRLKAIGMKRSEFHDGLPMGQGWFFSRTFDLAKGRHVEQLKLLIRSSVDLVIVDSARAVARSLSVDENHADFGKLVIRKIAKIISDCGKSGIITHHNSKGSGKAAGSNDILAGVWGGFNLKAVEGDEELRTLQTDKKRETSILWQLRIQRAELIEGLPNGWRWSLSSDLSHMAPDMKWRDRFTALLRQQTQPIGLRDAAQLMGLTDPEAEVLRKSVGRDTACRRWLMQKPRAGVSGLYFMPMEFRTQSHYLEQNTGNEVGVQIRETHPLKESSEMFQVGVFPCKGQGQSLGTNAGTRVEPGTEVLDATRNRERGVSGVFQVEPPATDCYLAPPGTKSPTPIRGVSLPVQPPAKKQGNVPGGAPILNGKKPALPATVTARVEAAQAAGCITVEQITAWVAHRGGALAKTETERVLKAQQRTPATSRLSRNGSGDDPHWGPPPTEPDHTEYI